MLRCDDLILITLTDMAFIIHEFARVQGRVRQLASWGGRPGSKNRMPRAGDPFSRGASQPQKVGFASGSWVQ